jgi:SAM-dependent methyltransferase
MIGRFFRSKKKKQERRPRGLRDAKAGPANSERLISSYLEGGRIPWSPGYREYKMKVIADTLADEARCRAISAGRVPVGHGAGIDERVVEYPWAFAHLLDSAGPILDAGSVLNFESIIMSPGLDPSRLTIAGLAVEKQCHYAAGVSYQLCDLRRLPFRDGWFGLTLCLSTLEHIGMNNEIYGHDDETAPGEAQAVAGARPEVVEGGHLDAVAELMRVTRPDGMIAISVPVGTHENHGFFQQFDRPMIDTLIAALSGFGEVKESCFLYRDGGWSGAAWEECQDSTSHNPQTGRGKGDDGAAHCRAVGCFLVKGRG